MSTPQEILPPAAKRRKTFSPPRWPGEDDPFTFTDLSSDLQLSLVKKLDFYTFSAFTQCSQLTNSIGNLNSGHVYPIWANEVHIGEDIKSILKLPKFGLYECKYLIVKIPLTDELIEYLLKVFRKADKLNCEEIELKCKPELFNNLIKKLKVRKLNIKMTGNEDEFPYELSSQLQKLKIHNAISLSIEEFFPIKAQRYVVDECNFTFQLFAQHILEWTKGTDHYNKEFGTVQMLHPTDPLLSEIDKLGIVREQLNRTSIIHSEFYAIRRDCPEDPVLILRIAWNSVELRPPNEEEDWRALEELEIPKKELDEWRLIRRMRKVSL